MLYIASVWTRIKIEIWIINILSMNYNMRRLWFWLLMALDYNKSWLTRQQTTTRNASATTNTSSNTLRDDNVMWVKFCASIIRLRLCNLLNDFVNMWIWIWKFEFEYLHGEQQITISSGKIVIFWKHSRLDCCLDLTWNALNLNWI